MKLTLTKKEKIVLAKYWIYHIEDEWDGVPPKSETQGNLYNSLKSYLIDQNKYVKTPPLRQKIAQQFAIPQKYYDVDYKKLRDSKYPNLFKVMSVTHLPRNGKKEDAVVYTSSHHYSKEMEKRYNQSDSHTVKTYKDIPKPKDFADFYMSTKEFVDKYYPNYDKKSNQNKNYSINSDDWLLVLFLDMNNFLNDITPSPLESYIENLLKLINVENQKNSKNTTINIEKNENVYTNELEESKLIWQGATWYITFGNITTTVEDTIGMHIIAHLIKNQGDIIRADKIYYDIVANILYKNIHSEMHKDELAKQEEISDDSDYIEIIKNVDKKAITNVNNAREKLEKDLQQAEIEHNISNINELQSKIKQIKSWQSKYTNKEGKPRKIPDRIEKARKAIIASVATARKNIEKVHPEFYKHLKQYLIIRQESYYKPKSPTKWSIKI